MPISVSTAVYEYRAHPIPAVMETRHSKSGRKCQRVSAFFAFQAEPRKNDLGSRPPPPACALVFCRHDAHDQRVSRRNGPKHLRRKARNGELFPPKPPLFPSDPIPHKGIYPFCRMERL
jgi:hypothetical protein